ncbi:MAG: PQQ-binding-like beta-propeller repeat protein [Gemmatimonadaceae bacterium]|nr:PQQ-binding-like beta-propeller repeat protein [Gemmatimonadaceae bacterium]
MPLPPPTIPPSGTPFRSTAWIQPGLNPNAAAVVGDTVVAITTAGDSIVALSASTGARLRSIAPPGGRLLRECFNDVASSRAVLVFSCGDIVAVDRRTLVVLWRRSGVPANNRPTIGGPDSSTVFFITQSARAAAVDARTGALRWEREVQEAVGGGLLRPTVSGNTVVWALRTTQLPDYGGLVGLDTETGQIRFVSMTPPSLSPINRAAPLDGPAQLGTALVTAGFDGQLYAFQPATGRVSWVGGVDSTIASSGGQTRFITITPEVVIATSLSGLVNGYRVTDGSLAFSVLIGRGGSILDRPVVDGDRFFVCNLSGQLASVRLGAAPVVEWTTSGFTPEKLLRTVGVTPTHVIVGEFSSIQRIAAVRR